MHSRDAGRSLVTWGAIVVLLGLTGIPLLFMLWTSLRDTSSRLPFDDKVGYTLNNYVNFVTSSDTVALIVTTTVFAIGSLAIGLAVAGILAWLVERTDTPLRNVAYSAILAQIAMPGVIFAIAWILLLSPNNGLINVMARGVIGSAGPGPFNIYSVPGMLFIQGLIIIPTTFLLLGPAFRYSDPSLEEAAMIAGASRGRVVRTIVVPLLIPAFANAVIYQFTTVVQAFDVPAVVGLQAGVPLLSTKVYLASNPAVGLPNYGVVSADAAILLVASALPLLWYARLTRTSARYAVISGRAYRPRPIMLGRWRWLGAAVILLYVLVAVALPAFIMFWMSVQPFYTNPSAESLRRVTFTAYGDLGNPMVGGAAFNTAVVAIGTAIGTTTLGAIVGWIIVRGRGRFIRFLDVLSFAPHIIPGVVVAVSALLFFLLVGSVTGVRFQDSLAAIVFALVTVTVGFSIRAMRAASLQISSELEEAAYVSGLSWITTMRRIVAPLLGPALGNVWIWAIIQGITNLTIVLLLYNGSNGVLSVTVFNQWNAGLTSSAAAIGVCLLALTVVLTAAARRVVLQRSL